MPAVDLAAIREKHAAWLNQRLAVSELVRVEAPDPEIAAAEQILLRLSDTTLLHLSALLSELARDRARITRLQQATRDARKDRDCFRAAHRDRQGLPSDPRHAGCRAAEEAAFERVVLDRWHVARDADCPVYGCDGERIELEVAGGPSFVRLNCGHEPEPGRAGSDGLADVPPPLSPPEPCSPAQRPATPLPGA